MEGGHTREAINNLKKKKKHARCPLNMLPQVIRNPLWALWMEKKKFWNVLDHPGNQKMFHFGLQASSRSARLFALQSHCGETALGEKKQQKKNREEINLLSSHC